MWLATAFDLSSLKGKIRQRLEIEYVLKVHRERKQRFSHLGTLSVESVSHGR